MGVGWGGKEDISGASTRLQCTHGGEECSSNVLRVGTDHSGATSSLHSWHACRCHRLRATMPHDEALVRQRHTCWLLGRHGKYITCVAYHVTQHIGRTQAASRAVHTQVEADFTGNLQPLVILMFLHTDSYICISLSGSCATDACTLFSFEPSTN